MIEKQHTIVLQDGEGNVVSTETLTHYEPVPEEISDRQFAMGLAIAGLITQAEALAFVKTGEVPTALQAMVDAIEDTGARFEAEMLVSGATVFKRSHPLVSMIASQVGWTEQQTDQFWYDCSQR